MKSLALSLTAACAALALQACDVRDATSASAPAAVDTQVQAPQPAVDANASALPQEPVQAGLPAQQPAEPVGVPIPAVSSSDYPTGPVAAGAQAGATPGAMPLPGAMSSETTMLGAAAGTAPAGQGTAAATVMSEPDLLTGKKKAEGEAARKSKEGQS